MTKKKEPHELLKMGRPTKYTAEMCELAFNLALLMGNDDTAIANALQINVDTFYEWQKQYPEFSESVRLGKEPADGGVARSLYQRAVGYTYTKKVPKVLKTEFIDDMGKKIGTKEDVVFAEEEVVVIPDVGAAKMWLGNRHRKRWSETQKVEVTGENGGAIKIDVDIKFV